MTGRPCCRAGITLLETLVTLGILAVLLTISFYGLSTYRNEQILNGETSQILSILNKARTETLASKSQLSYGVRINGDRVILYPTAFASSTPENEEYVLNSLVMISDIALSGGGLDVLFVRLTGETEGYGTFRISLLGDSSKFRTISVKQTGIIELEN